MENRQKKQLKTEPERIRANPFAKMDDRRFLLESHPVECQFLSIYALAQLTEDRIHAIKHALEDENKLDDATSACIQFVLEIHEKQGNLSHWRTKWLKTNDQDYVAGANFRDEMLQNAYRSLYNKQPDQEVDKNAIPKLLGISVSTYYRITNGKRAINMPEYKAFLEGFENSKRFWAGLFLYPPFSSELSYHQNGITEARALRKIYALLTDEEQNSLCDLGNKYLLYQEFFSMLKKPEAWEEDLKAWEEIFNKRETLYDAIINNPMSKTIVSICGMFDEAAENGRGDPMSDDDWKYRRENWLSDNGNALLTRDELLKIARFCGMDLWQALHLLALSGYGIREQAKGNDVAGRFKADPKNET